MSSDDLRRLPVSPALPERFRGVVLSSERPARGGEVRVHGALQVPACDFDAGSRVLDALALVATVVFRWPEGGVHTDHRSWMPFRDWIVLEDDVERTDTLVRGWFNVGLPQDLSSPCGGVYVVASVGRYASDVLTVRIG